jgi:hypothetical protein
MFTVLNDTNLFAINVFRAMYTSVLIALRKKVSLKATEAVIRHKHIKTKLLVKSLFFYGSRALCWAFAVFFFSFLILYTFGRIP